jgi:hypothetical protein
MSLSNIFYIEQEPDPEIDEQQQEPSDVELPMLDLADEPVDEMSANEGQAVEQLEDSVSQIMDSSEQTDYDTADQAQAEEEATSELSDVSSDIFADDTLVDVATENEERAHAEADQTSAKGTPAAENSRLDGKIPQSAAPARIYELRSSAGTPMKTPDSAGTFRQRDRAATDPTQGRRQSLRLAAKTPSKVPLSEGTPVRVDSSIIERAEGRRQSLRITSKTPSQERVSTSKYFATPNPSPLKPKSSPRPPRGTVSALPFPTLSAQRFGLIQEELASDPFRLLIAITFLVRTPGRISVPVFYELMEKYPTPHALLVAGPDEIASMIKHLGLSVVRTAQIQKYARIWIKSPPSREARYGVKNYPLPGDGADVRAGEQLAPEGEDPRASAWEIGHMTQGPYAMDSWRIFCRDVLLGRAEDWQGKGREPEFQPEWMRVLPADKELRAYLRWMWMREGWDWDPNTGDKQPLSVELREAVNQGRVQWDNTGSLQIVEGGNGIAEDA